MSSPQQPSRIKFKSKQDWYNFLNSEKPDSNAVNKLRMDCYKDIEQARGQPLLVYATNFLHSNIIAPNFISIDDVDGFTDLVNSVKKNIKCVDVLLQSPGGMPDITERLVGILRNRFEKVNFLIPHSAYSAATMLAISGNSITLHPSATLGPIDPQFNGIPAKVIRNGFNKIRKIIEEKGPEAMLPYVPLIEKYDLHLLELCEDAEDLTEQLACSWLKRYMLSNRAKDEEIKQIVTYLTNYDEHLIHSRSLSTEKLIELGLMIEYADSDLKNLLWEAHILINGFFDISSFMKLYESASGISWGTISRAVSSNQQIQKSK